MEKIEIDLKIDFTDFMFVNLLLFVSNKLDA